MSAMPGKMSSISSFQLEIILGTECKQTFFSFGPKKEVSRLLPSGECCLLVSVTHTGKDSIISWVTFRKEEVGRELQRDG